jgi:hypothetical protein
MLQNGSKFPAGNWEAMSRGRRFRERSLQINLNPQGVIAPALRAVQESVEIVSFCLNAMDHADLSRSPVRSGGRTAISFEGLSQVARQTGYKNWILSKGFHDLAKGIRLSLEEAYFYVGAVALFTGGNGVKKQLTMSEVERAFEDIRKKVGVAKCPQLMKRVNEGLTAPLHFENEFLSLQKTRNCLEHRNGVVGVPDLDQGTGTLVLSLPRLTLHGATEDTENYTWSVEAGALVSWQVVTHEQVFNLGDTITFNPDEFQDIGYGCWTFAQDLLSKLPQI